MNINVNIYNIFQRGVDTHIDIYDTPEHRNGEL